MYLINKDETEHTGPVSLNVFITVFFSWCAPFKVSHYLLCSYAVSFQESYVWKMYQERCWDFFPAGDCFRKQFEDQLS